MNFRRKAVRKSHPDRVFERSVGFSSVREADIPISRCQKKMQYTLLKGERRWKTVHLLPVVKKEDGTILHL
jgi:hypothetical protein